MSIFSYAAQDLFTWLADKEDILVLDVRNNKDFKRFNVESPYLNANLEQVDEDRQEELDLGKNECAATAYAKAQAVKEAS